MIHQVTKCEMGYSQEYQSKSRKISESALLQIPTG